MNRKNVIGIIGGGPGFHTCGISAVKMAALTEPHTVVYDLPKDAKVEYLTPGEPIDGSIILKNEHLQPWKKFLNESRPKYKFISVKLSRVESVKLARPYFWSFSVPAQISQKEVKKFQKFVREAY